MSQTKGLLRATPCPHCRRPNDFRGLEDYGLEKGNICNCDHCGRKFQIARVSKETMIWLKPV